MCDMVPFVKTIQNFRNIFYILRTESIRNTAPGGLGDIFDLLTFLVNQPKISEFLFIITRKIDKPPNLIFKEE